MGSQHINRYAPSIVTMYTSRNFGPAIVVFDGYRIPSTKYTTHQRRTGGKVGIEVTFTGDMKLTMSKDVYLPFERRQQTELHRHVESLPAACWMPHRIRRGWCRPVDCANSSAIRSYEEHCPRGRRYRSGHDLYLFSFVCTVVRGMTAPLREKDIWIW